MVQLAEGELRPLELDGHGVRRPGRLLADELRDCAVPWVREPLSVPGPEARPVGCGQERDPDDGVRGAGGHAPQHGLVALEPPRDGRPVEEVEVVPALECDTAVRLDRVHEEVVRVEARCEREEGGLEPRQVERGSREALLEVEGYRHEGQPALVAVQAELLQEAGERERLVLVRIEERRPHLPHELARAPVRARLDPDGQGVEQQCPTSPSGTPADWPPARIPTTRSSCRVRRCRRAANPESRKVKRLVRSLPAARFSSLTSVSSRARSASRDVGLLQASRDALDGKVRLTPPGVRLRGNVWVEHGASIDSLDEVEGPAVIGANARIEPGARVGAHTVLGSNAVIKTGAQVADSVLGENVYLASGAVVNGAILGNGVEVHENANIAEGAVVGDRSIVGRNAVVANNVKIYPFKNIEPGSAVRSSIVWESRGPSTLFGRNGVRGLANVDVTPELAMRLAMAYGTVIAKDSHVTTSRDTHHACRVFKRAIISGLNSTGVNVRDLTVATVAINRFDIKSGAAVGGIHVQMSLDDPDQIEILFSESPGVPLDGKKERAVENLFFREDFRRASFEEMGMVLYPPRAIETYTNSLLENWNTLAIRSRQPRLVIDYSASAPAFFFSNTLDKLGVETVSINAGSSSRKRFTVAETLPQEAARVADLVKAMEADVGVILDPGAEYLYVVDEKGRLVADSALLLVLLQQAGT